MNHHGNALRRIGIFAPVLILCALVAVLVLRESEPSCDGRSLSSWVLRAAQGGDEQIDFQIQAEQAISRMGARTIPTLMQWARYEPEKRSNPLRRFVERYLPLLRSKREEHQSQLKSAVPWAFRALGENGRQALPQLAQLAQRSDPIPGTQVAAEVLIAMQPLSNEALNPILKNGGPSIRRRFIEACRDVKPYAHQAIPWLVTELDDPDPMVAAAASFSLGQSGAAPDVAVPALMRLLTNQEPFRRSIALDTLNLYGPAAKPALPAISNFLADPDKRMREKATRAVQTIAR
jgi:HEAT repeat protein